jgi:iron complex outermembrane receptor protein
MLRGELLFNLSPDVNLLVTASTLNSRDPVATNTAWWETPTRYIVPGAPLPTMPPQPPIPLASRCDFSAPQKFDPRKYCHDWHESASNKLDLFTGTLNWDLGFATLTSVTGYETNHVDQSSDGDGSNLPMAAGQLWTLHQRQLSEEVRLASHDSDSPLSWLGGFIYFYAANYENFIYFDTGYNDYYTAPPFSGYTDAFHFHNGGNSITKAWAPFGQVDYDFGKTSAAFPLTLSLGLRYSHDERSSTGFLDYQLTVLDLDFPQTFGFDKTWAQWTGNLTARYQFTPEVMAYATVARGYLSGGGIIGLGSGTPFVGQQYNPEHVWSYELGLKSQWLDNRLQLNAAAFHEDISNMQVFFQSGVTSGVENAAKSRVNGLEIEAVAIPVDNLRLNATVSLSDAKYVEYVSADTRFAAPASPCFDPVTNPLAQCNFKGNRLNQTPPYTVDLGAEYTFITPMGSFTPRAEVFFSGEVFFTPPNNPLARQSPYHQTDLHLTWNSVDNRWWADAFVKNIENKDIISNDGLQSSSLGLGVQEPDNYAYYPPRTFGLRVGVHL